MSLLAAIHAQSAPPPPKPKSDMTLAQTLVAIATAPFNPLAGVTPLIGSLTGGSDLTLPSAVTALASAPLIEDLVGACSTCSGGSALSMAAQVAAIAAAPATAGLSLAALNAVEPSTTKQVEMSLFKFDGQTLAIAALAAWFLFGRK